MIRLGGWLIKIVFCVAVAVFFLLPVLCLAEEAPSLLNEVLEPQMEGREMEKLQRSLEEAMTS